MTEPEKRCALHDQMVRRWGRCVCAHPVNTSWSAAHPPPEPPTPVTAPRHAKHIRTPQQRMEWERGESSRIRRNAIKRGAPNDPSHKIIRMAVYLRDAGRCQMCGRLLKPDVPGMDTHDPDRMTIDHIVPVSKGGTHTYDNVRAACEPCNTEKGDS